MDEFTVAKHIVTAIRNGHREFRAKDSRAKTFLPFDPSAPVLDLPHQYIRECWCAYLKQVWSSVPGMSKYGEMSFQIAGIVPSHCIDVTENEAKGLIFKWVLEIVAESIFRCVFHGKSSIMRVNLTKTSVGDSLYLFHSSGKNYICLVIIILILYFSILCIFVIRYRPGTCQ
jgi:hypothetical protein